MPSQVLAFTWLNGEPVNVTATRPFWVPNKPLKVIEDGSLLMVRNSLGIAPALHLRETVLAVRMQLLQVLSKLVKIGGH